MLNILGWEPLKEQRVKAKAKIMFKTLNNMGPNCLKELFTFKKEILNRSLRNSSSTIRLPKPNTNNMKKSFMYDGASIWNSLPKNIRESNSLSSFKRKIATYTPIRKRAVKVWRTVASYTKTRLVRLIFRA